jgi:putative ATPase
LVINELVLWFRDMGKSKSHPKEWKVFSREPLASRMRPQKLEDFIGQEEIIGPQTLLRKAIEEDRIFSMILYGPPGSGKTSLAQVIANRTKAQWRSLSAISSGVSEVRKVIQEAEKTSRESNQPTILFIDEIHRFSKSQQDALLSAVESGIIILIGSTTENPFFEIISPLLSRCRLYVLRSLKSEEIKTLLKRAVSDEENGLGKFKVQVEDGTLDYIADVSGGDARVALNILELAFQGSLSGSQKVGVVTRKLAKEAAQKRLLYYDKSGDAHYDTISAFIKSLRGSDPDAAVYYLARLIASGEDPKFIARRMVIFASEDIGNADPQALLVATAAFDAVNTVGLPEARLNLAQAAIYLSCAPKSNSVIKAIDRALADVESEIPPPIPNHLRDAHYPGAKKLGRGQGYKYPHNYPDHYVNQDYLPSPFRYRRYYFPSETGYEKTIKGFLARLKKRNK